MIFGVFEGHIRITSIALIEPVLQIELYYEQAVFMTMLN